MGKKDVFTKILAITGTMLVWLPILVPILLSAARFMRGGMFLFDFLIPAELFLVALSGGLLLLWSALRAHSRRGLIGWGLGIATGLLAGGLLLATVTGLASGETEPAGIWWALVLTSIIVYSLLLVMIGIGGVLLLRDLFGNRQSPEEGLQRHHSAS